jgi:hypothetical protein
MIRLTQDLDGVDQVPVRAVPYLTSVVALIGVSDVSHLQIIAQECYPRVGGDFLLTGGQKGHTSLPYYDQRTCK